MITAILKAPFMALFLLSFLRITINSHPNTHPSQASYQAEKCDLDHYYQAANITTDY